MPSPAPTFHVTAVNLSRDARSAVADAGPVEIGNVSARELRELLEVFVEIEPAENLKCDCELRVQNRRHRFIVRTENRKLMLHDARNPLEPAYVLSAEEIIAELDGSAAAKRTTPPIPIAIPSQENGAADDRPVVPVIRRPEPSRAWPIGLGVLVALLAGYLVYSFGFAASTPTAPELTPLTTSERQAEDAALVGVYTTGPEPGRHGIILMGDGKLKLFRVNAQAAPSVVYGTYTLGRLAGKVHLATDQPGGLIKVVDRESLEFCGEVFKRVP